MADDNTQLLSQNLFTHSRTAISDIVSDDEMDVRRPYKTVDDIEMEERKVRKRAPQLRGSKKKKNALINWFKELTLLKIGWVIILALSLRLVFVDRGVIDFYQMEEKLDERQFAIDQTRFESQELQKEIVQIQKNKAYQKQLARDHLGVIAENEYLILFANDSKRSN